MGFLLGCLRLLSKVSVLPIVDGGQHAFSAGALHQPSGRT